MSNDEFQRPEPKSYLQARPQLVCEECNKPCAVRHPHPTKTVNVPPFLHTTRPLRICTRCLNKLREAHARTAPSSQYRPRTKQPTQQLSLLDDSERGREMEKKK